MAARTVVDPEGNTWRIKRRWVHRTVRWRGPKGERVLDFADAGDLLGFADELPVLGVMLAGLGALLLALAAVFFVIPAMVFALELLVVLLAIGLGVAARILFRRPWTVEARRLDTRTVGRTWKVVGWKASGELVETLAERVRSTGRVGDVTWTGAG